MAPNIVEEVLDFRLINFTGTTYLRIGTQNAPKLLGPHMLMTRNAEVLDFGPFIFNGRTYLRIGLAFMDFHRAPEPNMAPNSWVLMWR